MAIKFPLLHKDEKAYAVGAIGGALFAIWMGFGNFGWQLTSGAEAIGKKQAALAVTAAYAGICDAQFTSAPKFQERLAALEKADRWSRGDLVVKAGFAAIPGQKEANRDVGQACADMLLPEKVVSSR
jgi:hypothetical protein